MEMIYLLFINTIALVILLKNTWPGKKVEMYLADMEENETPKSYFKPFAKPSKKKSPKVNDDESAYLKEQGQKNVSSDWE